MQGIAISDEGYTEAGSGAVLENDWYVVYDNINIAMKHHHQRVEKRDTFDNGTAATAILIPNKNAKNDEPIPVFTQEPRSQNLAPSFFSDYQ